MDLLASDEGQAVFPALADRPVVAAPQPVEQGHRVALGAEFVGRNAGAGGIGIERQAGRVRPGPHPEYGAVGEPGVRPAGARLGLAGGGFGSAGGGAALRVGNAAEAEQPGQAAGGVGAAAVAEQEERSPGR